MFQQMQLQFKISLNIKHVFDCNQPAENVMKNRKKNYLLRAGSKPEGSIVWP